MKRKIPNSVVYFVLAPDTRQNEVIKLFMDTFSGAYTCDVIRSPFPIKHIYCYIYINDHKKTAVLKVENYPILSVKPDVELTIYQDIETIPLMHPAIKASRYYAE